MRRSLWSETPESTKRPVYFDYNATTPVDPAVVSALTLWLEKGFGNPSSDHLSGREARRQVEALGADLLTLAGQKFYAPKGIGVLYVRRGTPLLPVMAGGGQERGLRSGTENVPTIAPLGTDSRLVREHFRRESVRMEEPRDRLHGKLAKGIPGLLLNGPPAERLPNTLNFSFPRVRGRDLLTSLPWIAASTGSACPGGVQKISSVLRAMGLDPERAWGAVRLSLGRFTTLPEIDRASNDLIAAWKRLVS